MISTTFILISALALPPHHTDAFSALAPPPRSVESTARKRLGKKSYIQKLTNTTKKELPTIYTPNELHNLASSLSKRKPGSRSYNKGWLTWRTHAIDAIRHDLATIISDESTTLVPANKTKFENLFFRLGVAADVGLMPSFDDAGARSGYALEFFCRGRNLADLFIDSFNTHYNFPQFCLDELLTSPILGGSYTVNTDGEVEPYSIVSLGGGPAYDYVGAALATSFSSYASSSEQQGTAIKATILDYEEGWGDLVEAMSNSTQYILQNTNLQCNWGGKCDITQSIFHENNVACLEVVNTTQLFVCQYCVAENAKLLQESNYIFFHDLFQYAKDGSLVMLSEVHPRLWPDIYHLVKDHCPYMQIGFNKNGRQMLLRKNGIDDETKQPEGVAISDKDMMLVKKFEELATYHDRKIRSGWTRQVPKRWPE